MRLLQELDDHRIIEKIFIDFDQNSVKPALLANNSDDYRILQWIVFHRILVKFVLDLIRILQEIDDHGIVVKFVLDLFRILQEIDDHGIIVKIFIYFDQNSFSQPYYPAIQMPLEFFKNCMNTEFFEICPGFDQYSSRTR